MTRCSAVPAWMVLLLLAAGLPAVASANGSRGTERPNNPLVVLLSVDALMPEQLFNADQIGLKIPNLRRLLQQGSYASAVTSVFPSMTYPCHASLITGTHPEQHGIINNKLFAPGSPRAASYYWDASKLKTPTLWDLASKARLKTANVDWPVSVGAEVDDNIPQIWDPAAPLDAQLTRDMSTKGLVADIEKRLGFDYPAGDWSLAADAKRLSFIVDILKNKQPHFTTAYFAALDTVHHYSGLGSTQAIHTVQQLDGLVGKLWNEMRRLSGDQATLVLVSDHGQRTVQHTLRLNTALQEAGLIQTNEQGHITGWDAYAWSGDATAALMLRNRQDTKTRDKVGELLKHLANNPAYGIDQILEPREIRKLRGYPGAAFVVSVKDGYMLAQDLGPLTSKSRFYKGTHGHLPSDRAMDAVFLVRGPGIPAGKNLGRISMVDVAPTVAGLLGLRLPNAAGRNVLAKRTSGKPHSKRQRHPTPHATR